MVASEEDMTVDTPAILDFMKQYSGPGHTLLHTGTTGAQAWSEMRSLETVAGVVPDTNILGVSHLGLMTPPAHPFYGENGSYHYCGHYSETDLSLYERCTRGEHDFRGETISANLAKGLVERIAYNPHFDGLMQSLDDFLAGLE
jgi:hypothetical protein